MLDTAAAETLAQSLVERARRAGADAADTLYAGSQSSSVQMRLGALEHVDRSEGEEIGLRLFVGRRSASVASSDFSKASLDLLVERAMAMAREAPEDPFAGLAPAERLRRGPLPDIDCEDPTEPSVDLLRARALEAEDAARGVEGVTNSNGGSAGHSSVVIALATSNGFSGAYRTTSHSVSAGVVAGQGTSMQRDSAWHSTRHLQDLDPAAEIGRLAARRAVERVGPVKPKPGVYPVLFDPRVSPGLLGHFASAVNGAAVARKSSFLQDRLGHKVFETGVGIVDDPLRRRGLRSHPFDGEGLEVRRCDLVVDGVLTGWMADTASARQLGIDPTGHAARGTGGSPGISPSNLFFLPGRRSREALLAAFPEAILVTELIGQGVNPVTGDYSRGAAGFMVRGGEIAEPVAEITIASTLQAMFATLEPASDLVFRRGIEAPTILVPQMTVASG